MTIRSRVTAIATGVVLFVLAATALLLVVVQRQVLVENLDEAITQRSREIARQVAAGDVTQPITGLGDDDTAAQVVAADGRVVASSANLAGAPPIADPPPAGGESIVRGIDELPHDDASFRVVSRTVDSPGGGVVVHVAGTRDDIDESIAALARSLALAVPFVVVVLAALVWWLVGRTLRPVEAIREQVDAIGGQQLDRRVPVPADDDEIARLAATMNRMLDRLEVSAQRERRFVADASHELRSPLTRMRAELEVDLAHPAGADVEATQRSVLDEVVRLQHMVDGLLVLATTEAPRTVRGGVVAVDELVARATRRARPADGVTLDIEVRGAPVIPGDADALGRAIANVVENAMHHATSAVHIGAATNGAATAITVTDDGPGIPPADHERVFERFARLDDARSGGGTGLGLAIAREIIERHGGTIAVDGRHSTGARVIISLPT